MDDIPQETVDKDIERFIQHMLRQHLDFRSFTDKEQCQDLVSRSQYLFQWASAACKFINGYHDHDHGLYPSQRLDKILQAADAGSTGSRLLDHLYHTILSQLFASEVTQERFRRVMATVLALREPFSLASPQSSALSVRYLELQAIIKPLGSLLTGVHDEDQPIHLLHSSFRDFLLDGCRSTVYHVRIQPPTSKSSFSRRVRYILSHLPCQSS